MCLTSHIAAQLYHMKLVKDNRHSCQLLTQYFCVFAKSGKTARQAAKSAACRGLDGGYGEQKTPRRPKSGRRGERRTPPPGPGAEPAGPGATARGRAGRRPIPSSAGIPENAPDLCSESGARQSRSPGSAPALRRTAPPRWGHGRRSPQ